ncbi:aromatic acid exporter family protein [Streptomyces sp. TRM 70351]|uniref:aromatic acid exporter family protein n=1 Tax=Streptomyces sp. TRM 70351 TaxID=3116552 RepID=UPI002E7B0AAC|nr:aromatic acid exporter family protein [Streptomyces sp. TRM 70351]MEE1927998.1 aromatic acid exporter family protein [Streptomyces sp. TRM 70351]
MNEQWEVEPVGGVRREVLAQGRIARAGQWVGRAVGSDSSERHTVLLIGKSALAACAAWVLAYNVLGARSPAFAPFSAVLMMQVTVYQSVWQSLRYVAAVTVGVAVQGALGFLAGPDLLTFALVAVVALAIGRWRALGTQGTQVATAAFFAFSTYVAAVGTEQRLRELGQIVVLVLIGCGVGVLVNLLVLPPMRYRSAEHGVRTLAQNIDALLGDMAPALYEGALDRERTGHWRGRAQRLQSLVNQARSAVAVAEESVYYNPRRLLPGHGGHTTFEGYEAVVDALGRTARQLGSVSRSLEYWPEEDGTGEERAFLRDYGAFLDAAGRIAHLLGEVDETRLPEQARHLCERADEALEVRKRLAGHTSLPLGDPSLPYGTLLVDAARLMDDLQHTADVLQRYVERAARAAGDGGAQRR